jgi:tetratricopeptide (TPR) repeat protein
LTRPKTARTLLLFLIVSLLFGFLVTLPAFSGGGSTGQSGDTMKVKTDAEIRAILEKWRGKIKPTLNQAHVQAAEKNAATLPVDAPVGIPPLTYEDSEDGSNVNITPKPNRRDWAYALDGFMYTFLGGNCEGHEEKLDLGFWCFLEAALLHMLPEHLASVAFHLNERGEYDDALSILIYARSLNPFSPTIQNNLAYALSMKGDHKGAYDEMSKAVYLKPDSERFKKKLKFYADKAGINAKPQEPKSPAVPPPSQAYMDVMTSVMGAIREFNSEFMYRRWNEVFRNCFFSSNPLSASSRDFQRLNDADTLGEQCCKDCYPEPGIIPDNIDECICACNIQRCQTRYASGITYFAEINPVFEKWATDSLNALDLLVEEMGNLVIQNKNSLNPDEIDKIEALISDSYLNAQETIRDYHKDYILDTISQLDQRFQALKETREDCGKAISAQQPVNHADLFGKRPPKLRRVPDSSKVWHIWFLVGDLKLYPDDTAKLSIGLKGVASAKLKYNFRTGDHGAGVGVGLNIGKALGPVGESIFKNTMKFEFFAFSDSREGLKYGVETGIRPKIGVANVEPSEMLMTWEN